MAEKILFTTVWLHSYLIHEQKSQSATVQHESLQAVGPVDGDDPAVWGRWQLNPGAVHRQQVALQAGLVPRADVQHPLPIDLLIRQQKQTHNTYKLYALYCFIIKRFIVELFKTSGWIKCCSSVKKGKYILSWRCCFSFRDWKAVCSLGGETCSKNK